jgi:hypothetical protein
LILEMSILDLDSTILDLDLESPNPPQPCSRIHRSQGGERPQDDTDPRFQFRDGLLYYQGLLYVSKGPS